MQKSVLSFVFLILSAGISLLFAQGKSPAGHPPKAEVYYFHPDERCPIDQAIEQNSKKVMQTDFAKEIREGTLKFQVINTDEKANATLVSHFDINTQALYIVKHDKGKEIKTDLTGFAFDYGKSDPVKFMVRLKDEVTNALK